MFYKYNALTSLNTYEPKRFDTVIICCYNILLNGQNPILTYLLKKDKNNEYNFIILENDIFIHEKVRDIFCSTLKQSTQFMGFKQYNNNLYAFYELFENNTETKSTNNNFEKCLVYEIQNTKKIKDTSISNNVVDFFNNNSYFSYLYDNKEQLIEIPITAYKLIQNSKTNYTSYNEILLEPNDDYYELKLYYSNEKGFTTMRYALFLKEYNTIFDKNQNQIYTHLKSLDSIIVSKNEEIYFKNKSQVLLL